MIHWTPYYNLERKIVKKHGEESPEHKVFKVLWVQIFVLCTSGALAVFFGIPMGIVSFVVLAIAGYLNANLLAPVTQGVRRKEEDQEEEEEMAEEEGVLPLKTYEKRDSEEITGKEPENEQSNEEGNPVSEDYFPENKAEEEGVKEVPLPVETEEEEKVEVPETPFEEEGEEKGRKRTLPLFDEELSSEVGEVLQGEEEAPEVEGPEKEEGVKEEPEAEKEEERKEEKVEEEGKGDNSGYEPDAVF